MANKLNKHTPNSDELLKRLETNDSAGLDDFEKEALEGFASLENPELARSLQAKLDARISEEYSQKKSGNRTFFYLSMAAGLILVIGLTVIFYNSLNSNKAELALSESAEQKESVPGELAPVDELKKEADLSPATEETEGSSVTEKSAEKENRLERKENASGETDTKPTDITTKTTAATGAGSAMDDMVLANKQQESNNGPVTAAVPPSPSEDQKDYRRDENLSEKEAVQPIVLADKKEEGVKARSTVGGLKKKAKDSEYKNAPGKAPATEALASEQPASATKSSNAEFSGKADLDNAGDAISQPVFIQKSYANAQAYIKSEIDKNATLKSNVKEFKAKLSIDENGKITKVKFLSSFANCANCEKDLESILLKMPNWKPAQKGGKAIKETLHFVYP